MRIVSPIIVLAIATAAAAENQVRAELIADAQSIAPGETFRVGVILHLPKRAHIYWRNPGDSGLATGIEWQLPEDMKVSEIQWPNPSRFEVQGLEDVNHGYEDEVLLYSNVTAPEDASGNLILAARAYWLLCLDDGVCIPEDVELTFEVLVAAERKPSDRVAIFDAFAARVPQEIAGHDFPVEIRTNKDNGELTVAATPPWEIIANGGGEEANYFPDAGSAWQRIEPAPGDASAQAVFRTTDADEPVFTGVLTIPMRNSRENKTRTLFVSAVE